MKAHRPGTLGAAAWLAFVGMVLSALHGLARTFPPLLPPDGETVTTWMATNDPAMLTASAGRLVALALAWYLAAATASALALRSIGWWRAAALVERAVPLVVRQTLHLALGVACIAAPASVSKPQPAGAVPAAAHVRAEPTAGATADDDAAPITMRRLADDGTAAVAAQQDPRRWTIEPGQHLWSVAERVLEEHLGRPPTDAETDPYWRTLVEVNRPRLADPLHPDLVFPGQVLELPPIPPADV